MGKVGVKPNIDIPCSNSVKSDNLRWYKKVHLFWVQTNLAKIITQSIWHILGHRQLSWGRDIIFVSTINTW